MLISTARSSCSDVRSSPTRRPRRSSFATKLTELVVTWILLSDCRSGSSATRLDADWASTDINTAPATAVPVHSPRKVAIPRALPISPARGRAGLHEKRSARAQPDSDPQSQTHLADPGPHARPVIRNGERKQNHGCGGEYVCSGQQPTARDQSHQNRCRSRRDKCSEGDRHQHHRRAHRTLAQHHLGVQRQQITHSCHQQVHRDQTAQTSTVEPDPNT